MNEMSAVSRCYRRLDCLHILALTCIFGMLVYIYTLSPSSNTYHVFKAPAPLDYQKEKLPNENAVVFDRNVPLVWVGGVPRSGTTLARAMLDAHPHIRCGEETRVIPRMLGMHAKTLGSPVEVTRLQEAHINTALLEKSLAAFILTIIDGHGEPAPLLCNKDPFALRSMAVISRMFPNSKFIFMIRDGRSVSHSIISRHVTIKGFNLQDYDKSLQDWNKATKVMWEACAKQGPESCLPVYYERLVLHPKEQMQRILNFLQMPWDDMVIHHEKTIGQKGGISLSKKELSTDQVDKPVNQEALSKWVNAIPTRILEKVDEYAPMLSRLGYDTHVSPPDYNKHLNPVAERTMNI